LLFSTVAWQCLQTRRWILQTFQPRFVSTSFPPLINCYFPWSLRLTESLRLWYWIPRSEFFTFGKEKSDGTTLSDKVRRGGPWLVLHCKIVSELLFVGIWLCHVRWDPCPHSMARPRVADGGTASRYGG
jgi:hypothetical protein